MSTTVIDAVIDAFMSTTVIDAGIDAFMSTTVIDAEIEGIQVLSIQSININSQICVTFIKFEIITFVLCPVKRLMSNILLQWQQHLRMC